VIVHERLACHGYNLSNAVKHLHRTLLDFRLGVIVHAEMQKVKQVVKVNLPVKLCECTLREVGPGNLPGNASLYQALVDVERGPA
jgi:hypothetical protein